MSRRSLALLAAFPLLIGDRPARAAVEDQAAHGGVEETIAVEASGASCVTADGFFALVKGRATGARRAVGSEAVRRFVFSVAGARPAMQGHLVIEQLDGRTSRREVNGESCEEVVDALALITALDIDPRASAALSPPVAEPILAPIAPVTAAPPPDSASRPDPAPAPSLLGWKLYAGGGIAATSGVAPVPFGAVPIRLEIRGVSSHGVLAPSLTLGFERTFDATATTAVGDAVFRLTRGFLLGCPVALTASAFRLMPCVRLEAGVLAGEGTVGKGVMSANDEARPWLSGGLAARAAVSVAGPVELDLEAGVGVPFVRRYRFQLDPNSSLGQVRAWSLHGAVGLLVQFL